MSKEKSIKISILIVLLMLFIGILIVALEKAEKITYAFEEENQKIATTAEAQDSVKISNAEKINIDEIIQKNSILTGYREEVIVEEEELEYITKYRNNPEIYIGTTLVAQEGRNGTQAITIKKTYDENGKLIKEEQMSAVVVKGSINKVIDIGTKKKEKPKVLIGTSRIIKL